MVKGALGVAGRQVRELAGRVARASLGASARLGAWLARRAAPLRAAAGSPVREEEGQGTTEYAILVGVLVVIAIAAIALFRGRIQTLWDSIASAINGL